MSEEASALYTLLVAHTFFAGAAGTFGRLYIGGYLLSTESINSPEPLRRFFFRYLVFSMYYLGSFLTTPLLLSPFIESIRGASVGADAKPMIYLVLCIPVAVALYLADCWIIVKSDPLKISSRKRRARSR
ncbi:hypothetical protein GOY17_02620 [Lysobacter soli]|uniref:hypothetical protein n=1 Tax=Lysobacter soli TaxID=453783 RepID=UPI0012ECBF85|nr:hypothetical protein [Lysobacter soli]QGW63905.1 hypothetical protein GOY17_02620 [Lysobacter soli]